MISRYRMVAVWLAAFSSFEILPCPLTAFEAIPLLGESNPITASCPRSFLSPQLVINGCYLYLKMGNGEVSELPVHAEALFFMGTAYVRKGQNDAATQVFALALDALKRSLSGPPLKAYWIRSRMLNNKCWIEAVSGIELDAALADCDQSLTLAPNDPDTLNGQAFALYRQKKFKEALAGFDSTLKVQFDNAEALFMRGVVKLQLGEEDAGITDIKAARAKDSNIDTLYSGYGIRVK